MRSCGRCGGAGASPDYPCWYCVADMCGDCWEEHGHCGHPKAELANIDARALGRGYETGAAKYIGGDKVRWADGCVLPLTPIGVVA